MELSVVKPGNKAVGTVAVSEANFAREYNEALVHQVVTAYLSGARQGTRSQKTRSEVAGGGKKPADPKALTESDLQRFAQHRALGKKLDPGRLDARAPEVLAAMRRVESSIMDALRHVRPSAETRRLLLAALRQPTESVEHLRVRGRALRVRPPAHGHCAGHI